MSAYRYVGTRAGDPTPVKGVTYADSLQEARTNLLRAGVTPRSLSRDYSALFSSVGGPLSTGDLVLFARTAATMLSAGVPLPSVYRSLLEADLSPNLKDVIYKMVIQLESGRSAAEAIRLHARQFPTMFPTLIQIGEDTGKMDAAFERLADMIERLQFIRSKVRKAMAYPITITIFAILAIIALLVFVLPKFVAIFDSSGVALPFATRVMLGASNFLIERWYVIIAAVVALVAGTRWLLRREAVRDLWDRYSIKVPILGGVALKGQCAQFARAFETLIASGIDLLTALELSAQAFTNRHLRSAILEVRRQVAAGSGLVPPMRDTKLFPPMVTTMLAVGEEVGEIAQMLSKVADVYEDQVRSAVDAAIELINPIMLVVFGGIVMMIMAAIYLPMIDMISAIN